MHCPCMADFPDRSETGSPTTMSHATGERRWRTLLLGIIAFAAGFWLLKAASAVAMPVLFALLLALAIWPVVSAIRDLMPGPLRWVGAATGLLIMLLILAAFLVGLGFALREVYQLGSELVPRLQQMLGSLPVPDILSDGPDANSDYLLSDFGLASRAFTALGITASTAAGIILILFLMLLMLTEAENWHQKALNLTGKSGEHRLHEIASSVGSKFRAYFATRFMLGSITAVLYMAWLAVFGTDHLVLWGILAVLLNFVPTVGSIVAGTLPVVYVLITRDPGTAALVAGGLLVIEQVMGNYVDPRFMGKRLAVSPLVVLASLLFWSILWGIPGALLAVPLTVLFTMIMAHIDRLKPAALLLTDCATLDQLDDYRRAKV